MGRKQKKSISVRAISRIENGKKPNSNLSRFIYDPLDQREFKRRMEESFAPVYLNSMSIIQGVALGLLCQQTFAPSPQQGSSAVGSGFQVSIIPYVAMAFAVIVGVSYEYNWFVGIHRWSQKFFDTLIPFILGFLEIGAILNLNQPQKWWILLTIFNVFGAVAFYNTWRNTKVDMFDKSKLFDYFKSNSRTSIFLALLSALYCLVICVSYEKLKAGRSWYAIDMPMAMIYIAFMIGLLCKDKKFVDKAHEELSLKY